MTPLALQIAEHFDVPLRLLGIAPSRDLGNLENWWASRGVSRSDLAAIGISLPLEISATPAKAVAEGVAGGRAGLEPTHGICVQPAAAPVGGAR